MADAMKGVEIQGHIQQKSRWLTRPMFFLVILALLLECPGYARRGEHSLDSAVHTTSVYRASVRDPPRNVQTLPDGRVAIRSLFFGNL